MPLIETIDYFQRAFRVEMRVISEDWTMQPGNEARAAMVGIADAISPLNKGLGALQAGMTRTSCAQTRPESRLGAPSFF
ncbi:MAG TPA: hypothetical protein VE291_03805 [Terracidiphilus sp.]|jgi:hypothetical protein|nr:hypothetical protein [Terracidiphilus sp.]